MKNRSTYLLVAAAAVTMTIAAVVGGPVEGTCVAVIGGALLCAHALRQTTTRDSADASTHDQAMPVPPKGLEQAQTPASGADPVSASDATSTSETIDDGAAPVLSDEGFAQQGASPEAEKDPVEDTQPTRDAVDPADKDASAAILSKAQPTFSYDAFRRDLFFCDDLWDHLKELVRKVRRRQERDGDEAVTGIELYLARALEESGLLEERDADDELPAARAIQPRHSGMFYLRTMAGQRSYGAQLVVLRVEAALNAVYFAHERLDDLSAARIEDIYQNQQRVLNSVSAQSPVVDTADWSYLAMPWQAPVGPATHGEWALRQALSEAIESAHVPYRLEADFRCNVSAGDVALEIRATPSSAFPRSAYVAGLGIVPTTSQMRRRESSQYAARIGLLLAAHAFRASERIKRVWVATVHETPSKRLCLYSGCIDRRAFCHVNLTRLSDPLATLRSLGVRLIEEAGSLVPVTPTFYLEDERFCPPVRHDLWHLSERVLPASAASSLGASRVSGLFIHEELPRSIAADSMLREVAPSYETDSTQRSVRAILDIAHQTSDLSVWGAAERVASKLVEGTLSLDDPEALREELVAGDDLTRAVDRTQWLMSQQRYEEAFSQLKHAVAAVDRANTYADSSSVAYRSFESFAERVLYNRLNANDKRTVVLVPDAYLMAHLTLSGMHLFLAMQQGEESGNPEATHAMHALQHARRAVEVAPVSSSALFGLVNCLERIGEAVEALDTLRELLKVAYHPHAIGYAYYRMAAIEWQLGDSEACQACYMRAIRTLPALLPMVIAECQALVSQGADFVEYMDEDTVDNVLEDRDLPLAPTPQTSYILWDGATASVDAEVFPVARNLMSVIESLTGDDVMRGIRTSLEREPDA